MSERCSVRFSGSAAFRQRRAATGGPSAKASAARRKAAGEQRYDVEANSRSDSGRWFSSIVNLLAVSFAAHRNERTLPLILAPIAACLRTPRKPTVTNPRARPPMIGAVARTELDTALLPHIAMSRPATNAVENIAWLMTCWSVSAFRFPIALMREPLDAATDLEIHDRFFVAIELILHQAHNAACKRVAVLDPAGGAATSF